MAGTCSVYVVDLAHAGTGVCAYSRYVHVAHLIRVHSLTCPPR